MSLISIILYYIFLIFLIFSYHVLYRQFFQTSNLFYKRIIKYKLSKQKMQHKLKKIILPADEQNLNLIKRKKLDLQVILKQNKYSKQVIDKLQQRNTFVDKKSSQQFQKLEEELKNLAIKINSETKKNRVLIELIQIMNSQFLNNKKTEQIQNSQIRTTREKKIKKQEYDIEQILQKHNQEIAKINVLREQVSSSRRQRVVYSNLFKKIQKEIKIYEQKFKETLLYAHQTQNKKKIIFEQINQKKKALEKSTNRNQQTLTIKNYSDQNRRDGNLEFNETGNLFLTNITKKKNEISNQIKKSNKNSVVHQQLQNYKLFFQKLKAQTGYDSIDEITKQFLNLQSQNEQLMTSANQINYKIQQNSQALKKLNSIKDNPRHSYQQTSGDYFLSTQILQNIHRTERCIIYQKDQLNRNFKKIQIICSLLNVKIDEMDNISLDNLDDFLKGIEDKLTELTFLQKQLQKNNLKQDIKKKYGEDNEIQIQEIIQKVDKYQQSQKIFSKEMFEHQYTKEINKFKKHKIKK